MTANVTKTVSTFPSAGRYRADGDAARISVKTWTPDGVGGGHPPTAILQLNHGMQEYIDRYDAFARTVAAHGWLVVGMDFIGHGDSVDDASQLGYTGVALSGGRNPLVEDMHALRRRTQAQWPGVPYVMFGHSMGSFVLRAYLAAYADDTLSGAVISGTGAMAPGMVTLAKTLLGVLGVVQNPEHRSMLFAALSIGPYNKPFADHGKARTQFEWLSRDPQRVDQYVADQRCGGVFSLAADRLLMDVIARCNAPSAFQSTPKDLPLLLVSGEADPVGEMGAGVTKVADAYRAAGVRDVTLNLFPQARHELLNETNRDEVTADILAWLAAHL